LLLALVVSTYCLSRKAKTVTKRTKSEGGGSWDEGYAVPGLVAVRGSGDLNQNEKLGIGTFWAPRIEKPSSTEDKIGWVFEMSAKPPSGVLANFMIRMGASSKYYIPYRWLSTGFTYSNPWNDYKYLDGWVTNDAKEVYHLRVLLPYKTAGWYINDDEGRKISTLLNQRRTEHIGYVTTDKSAAISAANLYLSNKPLQTAAALSATKFTEEKTRQNTELASLQTSLTGKQADYERGNAEINRLEAQLLALRNDQNTLNNDIVSISSQITAMTANIASVTASGLTASQQAASLSEVVKSNTAALEAALGLLLTEAPIRGTEIDAAKSAIINDLNKDGFTSNMNKIYP